MSSENSPSLSLIKKLLSKVTDPQNLFYCYIFGALAIAAGNIDVSHSMLLSTVFGVGVNLISDGVTKLKHNEEVDFDELTQALQSLVDKNQLKLNIAINDDEFRKTILPVIRHDLETLLQSEIQSGNTKLENFIDQQFSFVNLALKTINQKIDRATDLIAELHAVQQLQLPPKNDENNSRQDKYVSKFWETLEVYSGQDWNQWVDYLQDKHIIQFLNGDRNDDSVVLHPAIGRRPIVWEIVEEYKLNTRLPKVFIISGAGGEGKTAITMQAIYHLLLETQKRYVVFWNDSDNEIPHELLVDFYQEFPNIELIFFCDNGAHKLSKIYSVLQKLLPQYAKNFTFFITSRDTDLAIAKRRNQSDWGQKIAFRNFPVTFTEEDTLSIAGAWHKYLLDQSDKTIETIANNIWNAVETGINADARESGSLLGALIKLRKGKSLRQHIEDILESMDKIPVGSLTLRDIYAFIAIVDSLEPFFGISGLPKVMLSQLISNYASGVKSEEVIKDLGAEVKFVGFRDSIHIRHRVIAENAVQILKTKMDTGKKLGELVALSRQIYSSSRDPHIMPEIEAWTYLGKNFANKKNATDDDLKSGIYLTQQAINGDKEGNHGGVMPHLITTYANLLLKTKDYSTAQAIFWGSDAITPSKYDRGYYFLWAQVEIELGNYPLAVLLLASSLKDDLKGETVKRRLQDQITIDLLLQCFKNLVFLYKKKTYLYAALAVCKLSKIYRPQHYQSFGIEFEKDFKKYKSTVSFNDLRNGIDLAYSMIPNPDEFSDYEFRYLSLKMLAALFNTKENND